MNPIASAPARTVRNVTQQTGLPPVEAMISAIRRRYQRTGEWITFDLNLDDPDETAAFLRGEAPQSLGQRPS